MPVYVNARTINVLFKTFKGKNIVNINCNYTPWVDDSMFESFKDCTRLRRVYNINEQVINMTSTFENCGKLVELDGIPEDGVFFDNCFSNCESITYIPDLPEGAEQIDYTFNNCVNLTTAPYLGEYALSMDSTFQNCKLILEPPTIPDSVICMKHTFDGCSNMRYIPEVADSMGVMYYTYANCDSIRNTALTDDISALPENLYQMDGAFYNCACINAVNDIPANVYTMDYTFGGFCNVTKEFKDERNTTLYEYPDFVNGVYGCRALKNPPVLNATTNLQSMEGTFKFSGLYEAPTIPNTVTDMSYTFAGCEDLYTPTNFSENAKYVDGCYANSGITEARNFTNSIESASETFWNTNINAMPVLNEGLKNVSRCFGACQNLTTITPLPSTIINATECFRADLGLVNGNGLFYKMNKADADISYAMTECHNLIDAPSIPASATNVSVQGLYYNCYNLQVCPVVPDNVNKNLTKTFAGCESITATNLLPDNITSMAFTYYGCNKLTDVTTFKNAQFDAPCDFSYTFAKCKALTNNVSFNNVTNYTSLEGTFAESGLYNSIPLNDSVYCDTMKNTYSYSNIEYVIVNSIPSNIKNLDHTFEGCSKLRYCADIPDNVEVVDCAFDYCHSLSNNLPIFGRGITTFKPVWNDTDMNILCDMTVQSEEVSTFDGFGPRTETDEDPCIAESGKKVLYIPFKYQESSHGHLKGEYTTTYNTFTNYGYRSFVYSKKGIILKDIYEEGKYVDVTDWTDDNYGKEGQYNLGLTSYIGDSKEIIIVPNPQEAEDNNFVCHGNATVIDRVAGGFDKNTDSYIEMLDYSYNANVKTELNFEFLVDRLNSDPSIVYSLMGNIGLENTGFLYSISESKVLASAAKDKIKPANKYWVKLIHELNSSMIKVYQMLDENYTLDTLPPLASGKWTELTSISDGVMFHNYNLGKDGTMFYDGHFYLDFIEITENGVSAWKPYN